jgi:hypothetical protein
MNYPAMITSESIISAGAALDNAPYVPIHAHKKTGFENIAHRNVELRWPRHAEIELLIQWFSREEIYRAFGFSRPPSRANIANNVLPDLSTRERYLEAVEFLLVCDREQDRAFGFFVVFESRRRADPNQEIDFAVIDESYRGRLGLLRTIEVCVLSYLFAVRGAHSVFWVRRKREDCNGKLPAQANTGAMRYHEKGKPFLITRQQFKRRLTRRLARRHSANHDDAEPICLRMKSS